MIRRRREKEKMENKKEYRAMPIAAPDTENNEMIVEGRALVFNTPTLLWQDGDYKFFETIDPMALATCDMSDVCFRYNHSDQIMVMARTRKGSLQLLKDDYGLNIRASLFNIQPARDLYELIKVGAIDQMSFAFICEEDRITYEGNICTRTILKFKKIFDVSAVDAGAYGINTSISARNWAEAEAEARKKLLESDELRRRLILKTYF
jgi:HK97 family phage prohead protease